MDKIIAFIKKQKLIFIGIGVGMLAGFAYWVFIGCQSGVCPITGNPYISSLYGGIVGGLIFETLKKKK
jgi:hypothetical protein